MVYTVKKKKIIKKKIPEYVNMQTLIDTSHSQCMCTGGLRVSTSHLFTLNTGPRLTSKLFVVPQITLASPPLETRFSLSAEKIYTFSNECENGFTVSDSAQTSFHTEKLQHSGGSRVKTYFRFLPLLLIPIVSIRLLQSLSFPKTAKVINELVRTKIKHGDKSV